MKLFIYSATEEAPFDGLFEPIVSYQKVILSNHEQQITLFNQLEGAPIKELLPEGIIDPADETIHAIPPDDDRLFFIPLEMEDTFMKLLERLFKKTKWAEKKITTSKNDIGLVGDDELSQFYEKIETQRVLQPLEDDMMTKKQELEDLFNTIVGEENEIDAVLICTHDDNKTRIAYSSMPDAGTRNVDTDSFAVQIQYFVSMLKMTSKVNSHLGSLKTAEFLYSGGIVHITHLPQFNQYTFLVFVSATEEGIELLALHRKRNLEKIIGLLKEIFG